MLEYNVRGQRFNYKPRLKITEVFHSIQGEGMHTGLPCTFIRLTGCALRCTYCDTEYAFYGGDWRDFETLYADAVEKKARLIQITGGEPLHQRAVWPFIDGLIEQGFQPLIETSGAVSIAGLHPASHIVMDIKTPDSGELARMYWDNLSMLKPTDEVKFVVCSEADLEWSFSQIETLSLSERFRVLISPVAELKNKAAMAESMLARGIDARFQVQLHKILWGEETGR